MKEYIKIGILEITWWVHTWQGIYLYPAIELFKTGNTRGFKLKFLRYTIDFSWFPKRLNDYKNDPTKPWDFRK